MNNLIYWDLEKGKKIRTLKGGANHIKKVAFSTDGLAAASVSYEEIKIWDIRQLNEYLKLEGFDFNGASIIKFVKNNKLLVVSSDYGLIEVWKLDDRTKLSGFYGYTIKMALKMAHLTDDQTLLILGAKSDNQFQGYLNIFNLNTMRNECKLKYYDEAIGWLNRKGIPLELIKGCLVYRNNLSKL